MWFYVIFIVVLFLLFYTLLRKNSKKSDTPKICITSDDFETLVGHESDFRTFPHKMQIHNNFWNQVKKYGLMKNVFQKLQVDINEHVGI